MPFKEKFLEEIMKTLKLTTYTPEETVKDCELERIPEVLKEQINSCFRSPFFSEDNKINCFGPFTMTFAVRTAKNILLEVAITKV